MEIAAGRANVDVREAGVSEQILDAVSREAKVIVRRLVDLPVLGDDEQQPAAAAQGPRDLAQHPGRFAHVFERHDVEAGIEGLVLERERKEVGHGVEAAVVPRRVAGGAIDAAVALIPEEGSVLALARARIQDPRGGGKPGRELRDRALDRGRSRFSPPYLIASCAPPP